MKTYKTIALAFAALMAAATASASPLTPSQALAAARSSVNTRVMKAPARNMELVKTVQAPVSNAPAVYVFAAPDDGEGFIIASADDAYTPLLGYSDEGSLDIDNLPPAMVWWLNGCAATIEAAVNQSVNGLSQVPVAGISLRSSRNQGPSAAPAKEPARASRAAISPICSTKWNQGAPYNNLCPTVSGQRCVTGCVATAVAQIMKVHQWPTTGTGSKAYNFKYNGYTYSDSFDFGATTFQWNKMLNSYTGSSTSAQKNAVATLMHAVGVAAEMSYSPGGSGAGSRTMASGLITYLGYDKALADYERNWFEKDEWNDMVYAEIAAGRPVYYAGDDGSVGHAFVCDGYSSDDMFHINWGWGGTSNGYFLLNALDPDSQGIGGGSGESGFNYGQDAFFGMRPDAGSTEYAAMMCLTESLTTDKTSYTRSASTPIKIMGSMYNFSIGTINVTVGYLLEKTDGTTSVVTVTSDELDTYYGWGGFQIATSKFPVGSYDVYPAFKTSSQGWRKMYYDRTSVVPGLHFEVTNSNLTVSATSNPNTGDEDVTLKAELADYTPLNGTDEGFYPGHSYNFTFGVMSTGNWNGEIDCVLFDESGYLKAYTEKTVSLSAGTVSLSWDLEIPSSLPAGEYYLGLASYDESTGYDVLVAYKVNVTDAPEPVEEMPATVYLLGDINGSGWNTAVPAATSEGNDGIYIFNNIKVNNADKGYGYFSFATALGANWNAVNSGVRFGAVTAGAIPEDGELTTVDRFEDSSAASCRSWKLPVGNYSFVLDLRGKTLAIYAGGSIHGDANSDGAVDAVDVAYVVDYLLGRNHPEFCFSAADFNGDEIINATDISFIIGSLVGQISFNVITPVVAVASGDTFSIDFALRNTVQCSTFQWWVDAPSGLNVAYDEDEEEYVVDFGSRLSKNYSITADYKKGTHEFLVLGFNSTGKKLMAMDDGLFCTMGMEASAAMGAGEYEIIVRDSNFNWTVGGELFSVRPETSTIRVIVVE